MASRALSARAVHPAASTTRRAVCSVSNCNVGNIMAASRSTSGGRTPISILALRCAGSSIWHRRPRKRATSAGRGRHLLSEGTRRGGGACPLRGEPRSGPQTATGARRGGLYRPQPGYTFIRRGRRRQRMSEQYTEFEKRSNGNLRIVLLEEARESVQ